MIKEQVEQHYLKVIIENKSSKHENKYNIKYNGKYNNSFKNRKFTRNDYR